MTRDRRVSPAVSSRSAARVCSTSRKPNAASRSSAASGDSGPVPGERVEQRREEELLVDRAHRAWWSRCSASNVLERGALGAVAVAEHAGEARPRLLVGRERVGLLLVAELEPVLDRAQEPVRAVEAVGVGAVRRSRRRRAVRARRAWWASGSTGRGGRGRAAAAAPRTRCRGCRRGPRLSSRSLRPLRSVHLLGARLHRADLADRVGVEHARATRTASARVDERARRGRRRRRPAAP